MTSLGTALIKLGKWRGKWLFGRYWYSYKGNAREDCKVSYLGCVFQLHFPANFSPFVLGGAAPGRRQEVEKQSL